LQGPRVGAGGGVGVAGTGVADGNTRIVAGDGDNERYRLFGAVSVGPWTAWPLEGSTDADPYSLAMLARTGEVPLGAGEGLSFTAQEDGAGELLSGKCTYEIKGETPAARLWTLTAYDATGRLMVIFGILF